MVWNGVGWVWYGMGMAWHGMVWNGVVCCAVRCDHMSCLFLWRRAHFIILLIVLGELLIYQCLLQPHSRFIEARFQINHVATHMQCFEVVMRTWCVSPSASNCPNTLLAPR